MLCVLPWNVFNEDPKNECNPAHDVDGCQKTFSMLLLLFFFSPFQVLSGRNGLSETNICERDLRSRLINAEISDRQINFRD